MARPLDRVLSWEGCFNVRDIGGYRTDSGGRTRWRSLVRADNLRRLTPAGCAALADYGVRTVIVLRAPFELRIDPSPFAVGAAGRGLPGAPAYLHVPVLDRECRDAAVADAVDAAPTVEAMYELLLERCREQIGAVISAIASAREGGVLVYCHAGKDRTGLVAALVLAVAGVRRSAIARDYALSDRCLRPLYEAQLGNEPDAEKRAALKRSLYSPLNAARPRTMLSTLAHLEERHGGVGRYLRGAGVEQRELERLRTRMGGRDA